MKEYNRDYEKDSLNFPSRTIAEKEKEEGYHRQWAKAIYSAHIHDESAIPNTYSKTIARLRRYGAGRQPIDYYIKQRRSGDGTGSTSSVDGGTAQSRKWDRDGMDNIDTSIISVAPRVKSMVKAYLKNIREEVIVDTIDPVSGAKQEDMKWRSMLYSKNKDFIENYEKAAGLQPDTPEFLPETVDELEMYAQAGGFKLAEAMTMEQLVRYTMEISGYDDELENQIYDDLMDVGIAATKTKLDPEDLKYKDEYVDVANLVVQHSRHNDFHDIEWAGHVEYYTISRLRKFFPGKPEEYFRDIAFANRNEYGNMGGGSWDAYNKVVDFGSYGYDQFTVAVFESEWRDEELEEAVFYDNKYGKTSKLPVTEETMEGLSSRKRYVKSKLEKRRECNWVIGTDCTFGWGEVNMQDRPAGNKTASNYHIRALSDAPLIYQLVPVLDDLQISWLRFQDARARAVKDGYAVNITKLQAISDGQKTYKIAEILQMWKENGLLMYKDSFSGKYEGGKTLPVDRLPATLLDELQEFISTWDHALKRMEDLTGINALILGATPDPDAPVGTQKLSVASSASAIRPLGLAMNAIKRESAQSFMRRFKLAAKARKDIVLSYEGVVGKRAIEQMIEGGRSMVDYGMFFHPRPTDAEKQALLESARISMQNRREGKPGIDLQTYMFIQERLYANANLKSLRVYLGYKEKQIAKEDEQHQLKMINAQADRNDRSAQIAAQGEAQKKQMDVQGKLAEEKAKGDSALMQELVKKDEGVADSVARRMGLKQAPNPAFGDPNAPSDGVSP